MKNNTYQLEAVSCPSCILKIEGMLKKTKGVKEYEVLFNSSRVKVTFDEGVTSTEAIQDRIEKLGYPVVSVK